MRRRRSLDERLFSNSAKRRAAHKRCPRCKKMRKIWMRANQWGIGRVSFINVAGEGKVCWICRIREIQPDWRPGLAIPQIPPFTIREIMEE